MNYTHEAPSPVNPVKSAPRASRPQCAVARRHLRIFDGAPDPRLQASLIHGALSVEKGWSFENQTTIDAMGDWLLTKPPLADLRARCEQLLDTLR